MLATVTTPRRGALASLENSRSGELAEPRRGRSEAAVKGQCEVLTGTLGPRRACLSVRRERHLPQVCRGRVPQPPPPHTWVWQSCSAGDGPAHQQHPAPVPTWGPRRPGAPGCVPQEARPLLPAGRSGPWRPAVTPLPLFLLVLDSSKVQGGHFWVGSSVRRSSAWSWEPGAWCPHASVVGAQLPPGASEPQ